MNLLRMISASACAAFLCGCGEPKYSVSGNVTFADGKPAYVGTMIMFTSADGLRGGVSVVTRADGGFEGVSFEKVGDGLPAGTYSVIVRPPDRMSVLPEVARTAPPNFGIQHKYMVAESSGFQLDLEEDVKNYTLTLNPLSGSDASRLKLSSALPVDMTEGGDKK
jgi:hypothetical protein